MKFRCSALHRIMKGGVITQGLTEKQAQELTELLAKVKLTDKQAERRDELIAKRDAPPTLSKGAISEIQKIAKEDFFGYSEELEMRQLEKGIRLEADAIKFAYPNATKNTVRKSNEYITGECDIELQDEIVDIKLPFTIKSMPQTFEEAYSDDYEWQMRGYMWLFGKSRATVTYVGMDTPVDLIKDWEDRMLHQFNHLPDGLRITSFTILRDFEIEKKMEQQCKLAIEEYRRYINFLTEKANDF